MSNDLLSVEEALDRILPDFAPLPAEQIALESALDRILATDIIAEVSLPPFANSSMDGFAVRSGDIADAAADRPVQLMLVEDIPAGKVPQRRVEQGQAARIMTGAQMPDGADTVVPVEATDQQFRGGDAGALPEMVTVFKSSRAGDYVRPVGEDIRAGEVVLRAGTQLSPAAIGMLAALGYPFVPVTGKPRVAILSTGDELIEPDEPLTPGKIRNSNSYTIAALVQAYGGIAMRFPTARDTLDDVRRIFSDAVAAHPHLILSSAGVSVGAFDLVRTVMDELGSIGFWRVNVRPGKPLAYGRLGGIPFFGLPGNPVSAMVTFDLFVRPVLMRLANKPDAYPTITVTNGETFRSDGRRSYIRVTLKRNGDAIVAYPTGTQSSGALMSMVLADGLMIVPEGMKEVPEGTELSVRVLRNIDSRSA